MNATTNRDACPTCAGHGHVDDDGNPDPTLTGDGCDDCAQTGRATCTGCGAARDECPHVDHCQDHEPEADDDE